MIDKAVLLEICASSKLPENFPAGPDLEVVIAEPYLPFIPEPWNGVLVLAEAQNLSKAHKGYRTKLRKMNPLNRNQRLSRSSSSKLGIKPWDDGSLKIAVEVALGVRAEQAAVSNGVLWSLVDGKDRNINPTQSLIKHSALLWAKLLAELRPEQIVVAGKVARRVLAAVPTSAWNGSVMRLHLPSPRVLSILGGLFDKDDLLVHYPEVVTVLNNHPDWFPETPKAKEARLIYACHAASLARRLARRGDKPQ